jgi:uncharacterized membrane protein (UPF0127 family)
MGRFFRAHERSVGRPTGCYRLLMARLVAVRNLTRGSAVASRAELADLPLRRLVGLMGRRTWGPCDGLLLRPCNAVHTCFTRMAIDVVFAGRDGIVVEIAPARRPWRVGPLVWRAAWVLELPVGAIERSGTRLDDRLGVSPAEEPPQR